MRNLQPLLLKRYQELVARQGFDAGQVARPGGGFDAGQVARQGGGFIVESILHQF